MYTDLSNALMDNDSIVNGVNINPMPCAAVLIANEDQKLFTDKQLLDFLDHSSKTFTTIYLVTEGNAYALRDDLLRTDHAKYKEDLDGNGDFKVETTEGRYAKEAKDFGADELVSKAYMYNQMNIGVSLLQCTTDLNSNMLNFQKVDACNTENAGYKEIKATYCGEREE